MHIVEISAQVDDHLLFVEDRWLARCGTLNFREALRRSLHLCHVYAAEKRWLVKSEDAPQSRLSKRLRDSRAKWFSPWHELLGFR
ncbi:hypothetical protein KCU61_g671, partial [Aureobasidium melanogenum]